MTTSIPTGCHFLSGGLNRLSSTKLQFATPVEIDFFRVITQTPLGERAVPLGGIRCHPIGQDSIDVFPIYEEGGER